MKTTYIARRIVLKLMLILLLTVQGVSAAWGQETTVSTWDGTITNNNNNKLKENGITKGDGTVDNPYLIESANAFAYFARIVQAGNWTGRASGCYWKLEVDIDLDGQTWTYGNGSGSFQGVFDGQGHTVKNFKVNVTSNANYALFTTIQGASSDKHATFKNLKIENVTFNAPEERKGNTQIGALIAYSKYADISNITVDGVSLTYGISVTGNNYVGGIVGQASTESVLSNLTVKNFTTTVADSTTNLNLGAVVGYINGSGCSITGCTTNGMKVTLNGKSKGTTNLAGLCANVAATGATISGNTVQDVTIQCNYNIVGTTNLAGLCANVNITSAKIQNNTVQGFKTNVVGTFTAARIGGLVAYAYTSSNTGQVCLLNNTVKSPEITLSGDQVGDSYIGGLVGMTQASKFGENKFTVVRGNDVQDARLTMSGVVKSGTYNCGALVGCANQGSDIYKNIVYRPNITLTGNIGEENYTATATAYLGGAVGQQKDYVRIDTLVVQNGTINGPASSNKAYLAPVVIVKNTYYRTLYVGGAIGYQSACGSGLYRPNTIANVAVDTMSIKLEGYEPKGVINYHRFSVGGVVGSLATPYCDANGQTSTPRNLICANTQIYAPYASTSPTVGIFGGANATIDTYDNIICTTVDWQDLSARGSWLYYNYRLGLSQEAIDAAQSSSLTYKKELNIRSTATQTPDADDSNLKWLTIDDNTLVHNNRHLDAELSSRTVLWWTSSTNDFATNEWEQNLYPLNSNAEADKFTGAYKYYPYFYQGVNYGRYSEDAMTLVAGLRANCLQPTPLNLTITDAQQGQRGFGQHDLTVSGATSCAWYVDGEYKGASALSLTPDWQTGHTITVVALDGSTPVAATTYVMPVGVFATKNGDAISGDWTVRGTADNPYYIDSPEAMRLLSMLSAAPISLRWEGTNNNQVNTHYNRAYYELSADIDFEGEEFIPISHTTHYSSSDATWSLYNQNHIFDGHFDGKGHRVRNFKIEWYGGANRSNNQYSYFGLFGAIGCLSQINKVDAVPSTTKWGDSESAPCVIQNLIVENALLEHKRDNTSFAYAPATSATTGPHVCLGVVVGVQSCNSIVQNVEVRTSTISDTLGCTYSLADKYFSVGGAVGRIQRLYSGTGQMYASAILRLVAVDCDIFLNRASFNTLNNAAQRKFNVGGIVGSIISNKAESDIVWPSYTYYSGRVNAPKAFVGPVYASVDYSNLTNDAYNYYCKHYVGKINSTDTRELNNAYYGVGYQIWNGSEYKYITSTYPADECDHGARTLVGHGSHASYADYMYQGVNVGTYAAGGNLSSIESVFEAAQKDYSTDGSDLTQLIFAFNSATGTLRLEDAATLVRVSLTDADYAAGSTKTTHTLTVSATGVETTGFTYKWYINGEADHSITSATSQFELGAHPQLVYVDIFKAGETTATASTSIVDLPRRSDTLKVESSIEEVSTGESNKSYTFTLTPQSPFLTSAPDLTFTYDWKVWSNSTTPTYYTAQECWDIDSSYIASVTKDGATVPVGTYDYTIYNDLYDANTNPHGYQVTYKKVYTYISADDYNALSAYEKLGYVQQTEGDYEGSYMKLKSYISKTDYDALTDAEKAQYAEYTKTENDTIYVKDEEGEDYTPVTTADQYVIPVGWQQILSDNDAKVNENVLTGASSTDRYYCLVTVVDNKWRIFKETYKDDSRYSVFLEQYPTYTFTKELKIKAGKQYVVYLKPVSQKINVPLSADEKTDCIDSGNDDTDGSTPNVPVKTWRRAFELLDGDTWDENVIVLMGTFTTPSKDNRKVTWDSGKGRYVEGSTVANSTDVDSDPGLSPFGQYDTSLKDGNTGFYSSWKTDSLRFGLGKNVTITGKYQNPYKTTPDTIDYQGTYVTRNGRWVGLFGDTRFQYMTFKHTGSSYDVIFCQNHNLEMGQGLVMSNYSVANNYGQVGSCSAPGLQIFGSYNNDKRFKGDPLNHTAFEQSLPKGGFSITIKSGFYSIICVGGRQGAGGTDLAGIQGTPKVPVKCNITIDIDRGWNKLVLGKQDTKVVSGTDNSLIPYDMTLVMAGNHEGAMYGDVSINVYSGRVGRIVNGSLGAIRPVGFSYLSKSYMYPLNAYMGRSSVLIDPSKSEMNTEDTGDERILFTEIYGGGLGRAHSTDGMICMPYYGHNSVTINGGKMKIPDDCTRDDSRIYKIDTTLINCGLYGGGAGGVNGIGIDDNINSENDGVSNNNLFPYWAVSESDGTVLYGNWNTYKTGKKLYITCHDTDGNVDETVDPQYAQCEVTINGGEFGTSTGVNRFKGIFAGGSGLTSAEFLEKRSTESRPNPKSGYMYGKSDGTPAVTLTITGGTIYGNVYGAGQGTDKYYTYSQTWEAVTSRRDEYKALAQIYGDVATFISGGYIDGDVFAGAAGVANVNTPDMARVFGNTTLEITGGTIKGNVYGGGENGKTGGTINGVSYGGNTSVTISGATIGPDSIQSTDTSSDGEILDAKGYLKGGNIFGGGKGYISISTATGNSAKSDTTVVASADVTGTSTVTINNFTYGTGAGLASGNNNIYGGGYLASHVGTTNVTINSGLATNRTTVYGGGLGAQTSCDSTEVTINNFATTQSVAKSTTDTDADDDVSLSVSSDVEIGLTAVYGGGNQGTVTKGTGVTVLGGQIFGDIYGGGNVASVGRTRVSISSGLIGGEIFGGGKGNIDGAEKVYADVKGYTETKGDTEVKIPGTTLVDVTGGDVIWKKKWTPGYFTADAAGNWTWQAPTSESTDYTSDNLRTISTGHNIYGGGNIACTVSGLATVSVTNGLTTDQLHQTTAWNKYYDDSTTPHFYVFGGGYGQYTEVESSDVTVNIEGEYGDYSAELDDEVDQLEPSRREATKAWRKASRTLVSDDETLNVYDNSTGIPKFTVLGVLGGGYAGTVKNNTTVTVDGNTFLHRVYGGGFGESSTDNTPNTTGQVGGNTNVYVNGANVYGDVFGGGEGVLNSATAALVKGETNVTVADDANIFGSVYGGGDIACVGEAKSDTQDTPATQAASAEPTYATTVNLTGGNTYGAVYAGGRGVLGTNDFGKVTGDTRLYMNIGKSIVSNDESDESDDAATEETEVTPYAWSDLYGGCAYGQVVGNTNVVIDGGMMGGDIYGGGYGDITIDNANDTTLTSADVTINTNVTINGGSWLWNRCTLDTDGNTVTWLNAAKSLGAGQALSVVDIDERFYDFETNAFVIAHNIYGGGNIACNVEGTAKVTLNRSPLTVIDDGSDTGLDLFDTTTVAGRCYKLGLDQKNHPQFSVFGAGYGERTWVNATQINAKPTYLDDEERTTYTDEQLASMTGRSGLAFMNIYGGGYKGYVGKKTTKEGKTTITNGSTEITTGGNLFCHNIYGGGLGLKPETELTKDDADKATSYDFGTVYGNTKVNINGGVVSMDVYGGGAGVESAEASDGTGLLDFVKMARVMGSTTVNVTDGKVFGYLFGGGDVANVGQNAVQRYDTITLNTTSVNISGGTLYSQVFAGGNGRLSTECATYQNLGGVYGNANITISGTADLLNRIYGGCKNGTVYGNTRVNIDGGLISYNIFGGGWGNVADDETAPQSRLTSADVKGGTNISVTGGEFSLTRLWNVDTRRWESGQTINGKTYSPQYDPEAKKYNINHNIYGGGNLACQVSDTARVTMTHGLLSQSTQTVADRASGNFFESDEWIASFNKVGTPHFSVFGAGYGDSTNVSNSKVIIQCQHSDDVEAEITAAGDYDSGKNYAHFFSNISVMDVVGGGYNGTVSGSTHVTLGKLTQGTKNFARHIYGGGFYNYVGSTNVQVNVVDCQVIYGGGLMGDVKTSTNLNIGTIDHASTNQDLYIHGNVYGGNDVSGYVNLSDDSGNEDVQLKDNGGTGTNVVICGGNIAGNVYGAGNGDYLYALGQDGEETVTMNESYTRGTATYDLVYTVPMRSSMIAPALASDAMKIVNINSWRPQTNKVNITLCGSSPTDKVTIGGSVFGGGNTATVLTDQDGKGGVYLHFGNFLDINGVYLGSDGEQLFANTEENTFLPDFQALNNFSLHEAIDWDIASNAGISTAYLPTPKDERPEIYPHLLDLYFQPVEMSVQPKVYWGVKGETGGSLSYTEESETGNISEVTIGTFCCGANRGNMNVDPDVVGQNGNIVHITFPTGLTITDKIVGGCNQANYVHESDGQTTTHVGGYLLGQRGSEQPVICLTVKNKFQPQTVGTGTDAYYTGANVYGGCYYSGTIKGDVLVDFRSNILSDLQTNDANDYETKLKNANAANVATCNVYGAGYGMLSYVRGNVEVQFGSAATTAPTSTDEGSATTASAPLKRQSVQQTATADASSFNTSANFVFGGGQQGNVVGNTTVRILNGKIYKSVTGGSYSGYQWGSTQVLVGYPSYYTADNTGVYLLERADKAEDNRALRNSDENGVLSATIKDTIYIMAGDIVSQQVVDAICEYDRVHESATSQVVGNFSPQSQSLLTYGYDDSWDNIDINIGEAVYGGGYSLASGSSVLANNTTVLKYTSDYYIDEESQQGYGGNTTMLIADNPTANKEHITISSQEMTEVTLPNGADLFGYYYKQSEANGSNYRYIYKTGTYTYGGSEIPEDCELYGTGTMNKVYEYDGEGGIFGDGHLSYAQGFRNAELTGYGYAAHSPYSAKIMNTFQRLDMLRLTDNCLVLLGARDYATNATNKTPYSIARVGEIQMCSSLSNDAVLTPLTNTKADVGLRNYMGLSNNIHYLGALKSDVSFGDKFHNKNGEVDVQSYRKVKKDYIDKYINNNEVSDESKFQMRNDGTAKNLIGVASGYALKIQNVCEKYNGQQIDDTLYYGPVIGVFEMSLVDVSQDEGGGYVYADNRHDVTTPSQEATAASDEDTNNTGTNAEGTGNSDQEGFLYTTGNFVFPHSSDLSQYIVDDCYPKGYLESHNQDIHYWYVTGYNYYYNLHITGYTYNSSNNNMLTFESDNSDNLTTLAGLKQGQKVTVYSWKMRSGHPDGESTYSCDLEKRNYVEDKDAVEASDGVAAVDRVVGALDHSEKPLFKNGVHAYNLSVCASDTCKIANVATYNLTMQDSAVFDKDVISTALPMDNALLSFKLTDAADNTTSEYYNAHLSKPCYATLVLSAPRKEAVTVDGAKSDKYVEKWSYVPIQYFYTKNEDKTFSRVGRTQGFNDATTYYYYDNGLNDYIEIKAPTYYTYNEGTDSYDMLTEQDKYDAMTLTDKYYYKNSDSEFEEIKLTTSTLGGAKQRTGLYTKKTTDSESSSDEDYTATTFSSITFSDINGDELDQTYYYYTVRHYTYTIYLTIDYVQGPDVTGNITIKNCALPGEMIELATDQVIISADQSMAPNAYYWQIGPLDGDGKFTQYDEYVVGSSEKPGVFANCTYNETYNTVAIPAYYFMNGYGVKYCFTANGTEDKTTRFFVTSGTGDTLQVHNFHLMNPVNGTIPVNLHLAEALARAQDGQLAEPRIYIADDEDLKAFSSFIDSIGATNHVQSVKVGNAALPVPQYGQYAQFELLNDVNVHSGHDETHGDIFAGTLHGAGHAIGGLSADKAFIGTNIGQIYNLGMKQGKIAKSCTYTDSEGNITTGAIRCCFEYNDGTSTKKVYRMDGTCDAAYTADDFRYGRVAYDLNQYYLEARYQSTTAAINNSDALRYLRDYYANGDYRYARRSDSYTNATSGVTYLRKGTSESPAYSSSDTRHDTSHAIDQARYVEATSTTIGDVTTVTTPAHYLPLFNATAQTADLGLTAEMNDYLIWGQSLQATPADYPTAIASHQVSAQTNRVWRVAGYYGDTIPAGYYYNAYLQGTTSMGTYVHDTRTTAIDFTCRADSKLTGYSDGLTTENGVTCYYAPFSDPATTYASFNIKGDDVTRNLLVYTSPDVTTNDNEAYDVVNAQLAYDEAYDESSIRGHHIVATSDVNINPQTTYFHLVERATTAAANNDLCVPIRFEVTDRAWYTRMPSAYAEATNTAWEGICLPFTVAKVAASLNGEITHFYGTPTAAEVADPNTNYHTLHHEYWLRGLTSVTTDAATTATFSRPGTADGLFVNDAQEDALKTMGGYTFQNSFFGDTYDRYSTYISVDGTKSWYSSSHPYGDYLRLTAAVPYIVSFPGQNFYEFDLTSTFYQTKTNTIAGAQSITFNAYGANHQSSEEHAAEVLIPVTSEMQTIANSYKHVGTFQAKSVEKTDGAYTINDAGTAFESAAATVLPFRTYMTTAATSASSPRLHTILIGGESAAASEEIGEEEPPIENLGSAAALRIYTLGQGRIAVESTYDTTLAVYTLGGQLCRLLEVHEGQQVYTGFRPGIYIVSRKKVRVQ